MTEARVAPYGAWKSPITSELLTTGSVGISHIALSETDVYWIEVRPLEGGRSVIVRRALLGGESSDLTPSPFNTRTRVHEYGGGDFVVSDEVIFFSNFSDQRLYRQVLDSTLPESITPALDLRYADMILDRRHNRLICVREDHTTGRREPVNSLTSIELDHDRGAQRVLVSGRDFYSSPVLSADGSRLAWLEWNHPNMPWDGCELWVGELKEDGTLGRAELIAGSGSESIFQPGWSPDGALHFVSDRSNWWNLYRYDDKSGGIEPLCAISAEFGEPQWVFGMSRYAFASSEAIVCAHIEKGMGRLGLLNTSNGQFEQIQNPYSDISAVKANESGQVVFRAASPEEPASIVRLDLATRGMEVLRRSSEITIDPVYLSTPQAIEFPTADQMTAHAFFYPPQNVDYRAPVDERPPLLVKSHGGPTSATSAALRLEIQYWTSRGIAVLDVNYGGSSGYGRNYRMRLNGRWGIVDVEDCVRGARYLVEKNLVDSERLMIKGGSAGGYTTLCALTFRDDFKAGASYYGVSDLEALVRDTHKFESRYLDKLIGPYPERMDLYKERSPINFTDRLSCPVIFFQGLEDRVVPPNQAEMMVEALDAKRVPVAYVAFEGEQHGFRRAENIRRALDGELYFYSRVFNFEPADPIEPLLIRNL